SRRRHTRLQGDWSSDVCSSDLTLVPCLAKRWLIAWPMPEAPPVTTATLLMVVYFFLTGLAASVGWREGDVQVAQPAHDEGGIVEIGRASCRERGEMTMAGG